MIDELRQMTKIMEIRKTKFFGHMRHDMFIINIMVEKINGKRGRERSREINLGNMKKLVLSLASYKKIKRLVYKREDWLQRKDEAFRQ